MLYRRVISGLSAIDSERMLSAHKWDNQGMRTWGNGYGEVEVGGGGGGGLQNESPSLRGFHVPGAALSTKIRAWLGPPTRSPQSGQERDAKCSSDSGSE